jgi:TonB family protein
VLGQGEPTSSSRQTNRGARGYLSRGALLSLLIHANLLVPLGIAAWVYGGREEARKAEDLDVAFEEASAADLPKDLPPLEPLPPDDVRPEKPAKADRKKKPERKLAEVVKKKPPEPAPPPKPEEVVVPPLPPMPPPPPPDHKAHEKIVELDDEDKKVEPPPDAKYLAQHNSKTDVETRARDTNLEKSQKGEGQASAPSKREDEQVGGEKEKIAELEEQKSALGRKAPDVTPHENPQTASPKQDPEQPEKKSLLSLRDPTPKQHELTPETADLSLPKAADGDVMAPRKAVRGDMSDAAGQPPAKRVKLALSAKDYEYLFGADAEADRRLAQKMKSTRQGKFQQRLARVQAALENFIPEVKPGNQTALNARAAPFAAYIARMHRSIHKLWGFGQLEDWEELSGSSPFNNQNLETTLELVLNRDGTIDKVTIVRTSGYLPYDAAAIDVAYTAGPYPDPPREIRSANGKIYVHWHFYRDGRQCTPAFTEYFILENNDANADRPGAHADLTPARRPSAPAAAPGAVGPGPALADTTGDGPRRLNRYQPAAPSGGRSWTEEEGASPHEAEPPAAVPEPKPPAARSVDPGARTLATRWLAGLAAGKTDELAASAVFPFRTSGHDVSERATLTAMLADLAREGLGRGDVQVLTAAGLRAVVGKLPPNLDDGSGQLYALTSVGTHEALILILTQRAGIWRVGGLVRR